MSMQKLRHWIYTAIGILILIGAAWFLLLRSPGITKESIRETLNAQSTYYKAVADYLISKDYNTEITDLPTIDHSFGIKGEDTNAYRDFISAIEKLYEKEGKLIIRTDGNYVLFKHPAQGGLLSQAYFVIAVNADGHSLTGEQPASLGVGDWQYYNVEGKP